MSPRFSLRAQIAVALALALLVGGALNALVVSGVRQRSAQVECRARVEVLAAQLGSPCAADDDTCLEPQVSRASTAVLRLRLVSVEAATAF